MMKSNKEISIDKLQDRIYTIRGQQVMLDSDLAKLYNVPVKRLNEQVKRNVNRFPKKFRFQLTKKESENLKSQFATSSQNSLRSQIVTLKKSEVLRSQIVTSNYQHGGRRKLPYVFTEQGVSMLSAVLKSDVAIRVSIQIIDAFVEMRKFLLNNAEIFSRLDSIETRQFKYQLKTDKNFDKIFKGLEDKSLKPKQGIFYDGQIFDAYIFIADLIKSAKKSIILVDNYIDESVLQLFRKRKKGIAVTIYTKQFSKILKQDLEKYNQQYPSVEIKTFKKAHDRFMIIDGKEVYHIGASLKDLGKKWFAFSKFDKEAVDVLNKLK